MSSSSHSSFPMPPLRLLRPLQWTSALLLACAACGGGAGGGGASVATAPAVAVDSPHGPAPIVGTTVLSATATDDTGVIAVQFLLDGATIGPVLIQPPWRLEWDTSSVSDGPHAVTARAWDTSLLQNTSSAVHVTVANSASNPTVNFSTFLGGVDDDSIRDVFVDPLGYVYVAGGTSSNNFPTTAGAHDRTWNGDQDVFVAQFEPGGGNLVFATYLGGAHYDRAYAIEVDDQGYVYVAGRAGNGFPTTAGAVQPNFGGDVNPSPLYGEQDGFIAKLKPDGSALEWCTYLGDDDGAILRDIDVDASGNVYVVSAPDRPSWIVTPGAFDTTFDGTGDGLVAEVSSDGASIVWGSYVGGSGHDGGTPSVRVADDGTVWMLFTSQSDDFPTTPGAYQSTRGGGIDLALLRIAPGGGSLDWATYFGGSMGEFSETHGLWVEADGTVTIAATTESPDLPFVPAAIPPPFQSVYGGKGGPGSGENTNYPGDAIVARFTPTGALQAFTYLGGAVGEGAEGVVVDPQGRVIFGGSTYSTDFPVTADASQLAKGGMNDAFLARFSGDLSTLEYSTFLGGNDEDLGRTLALGGGGGSVVTAGMATSTDFPTTPGGFDPDYDGGVRDAYVVEIDS